MIELLPGTKRLWLRIKGNISFIPSLWVLGFVLFGLLLHYLDTVGLTEWFNDQSQVFDINSVATARTILASIIGGVISLTVFSFSMVMIVLGQATSTLSPRLLPQLIRDRSHQTTLGLYLGVIVYAYITLIGIDPEDGWHLNSVAIFLAVVMMIVCLGFFVYFIASISRRIQVGEVIKDVHSRAVNDIRGWQDGPPGWSVRGLPEGAGDWFAVHVRQSGYVDATMYEELSRLAGRLGVRLYLVKPRSAYVLRGDVVFRTERPLSNEERQTAQDAVRLADNRESESWYLPAIHHIMEVAVKAMSPGINDPGTAVEAVNMLGNIFVLLLRLPDLNHYRAKEGGEVFFVRRTFAHTLNTTYAELRTYSRADPAVMNALFRCLDALRNASRSEEVRAAVAVQLAALREDGEQHLTNTRDRNAFLALFGAG